jgi:hypothetical protein
MKADIRRWRAQAERLGYTFVKRGPHYQCLDQDGQIVFGLSCSPNRTAWRAIRSDFRKLGVA